MNLGHLAFLAAAGLVAAIVGTAGGITSLISYPALLAVGMSPLTANVTNSIALIPGEISSALTSLRELRGHMRWLRAWAPVAVVGGASGAILLLVTPPGILLWLVPILIALASVLLLVQPRIAARRTIVPSESLTAEPLPDRSPPEAEPLSAEMPVSRAGRRGGLPESSAEHLDSRAIRRGWLPAWSAEPRVGPTGRGRLLAPVAIAGIAVYSGYFGAGAGVLVIAVVLLILDTDLARANALKNALLTMADLVPAVIYAVAAPVSWSGVIALGLGSAIGGTIGPVIARRVPHGPLRIVIACMGLGLAASLVVQAA